MAEGVQLQIKRHPDKSKKRTTGGSTLKKQEEDGSGEHTKKVRRGQHGEHPGKTRTWCGECTAGSRGTPKKGEKDGGREQPKTEKRMVGGAPQKRTAGRNDINK